jgi:hypothetical protein
MGTELNFEKMKKFWRCMVVIIAQNMNMLDDSEQYTE